VLASNDAAKRFYRREGGSHDTIWEPWTMPVEATPGGCES